MADDNSSSQTEDIPLEQLETRLAALKNGFENALTGLREQKKISSLAIGTTSRAWIMAAAEMETRNISWINNERLVLFEKQWADPKSTLDQKELDAFKLAYEALQKITVHLAEKNNDNQALNELAAIVSHPGITNSSSSKVLLARQAEAKVYWTNRLTAVFQVIIKTKDKKPSQELDQIVNGILLRAKTISQRRDIHYQARMDLLYLNNIHGLTSMLLYLAQTEKSPIIKEAREIQATWENHTINAQVADQLSLTWVCFTQISIPLTLWLAQNP